MITPAPGAGTASPLRLQPPDPTRLADSLISVLAGQVEDDRLHALLQLALGLVNGAAACFFVQDGPVLHTRSQLVSRQALTWSSDLVAECVQAATRALEEGRAQTIPLARTATVRILCCPVSGRGSQPSCCLAVVVVLGEAAPEPFLIILQLLAAAAAFRFPGEDTAFFASTEALLDFFSRQPEGSDLAGLLSFLRSWSGCQSLAIGYAQAGRRVRLARVNDVLGVDARTAQARLFQKVMQECADRRVTLRWPERDGDGSGSLLVRELVRSGGSGSGVALFLPGNDASITVLVLLYQADRPEEKSLASLQALAPLLGAVFGGLCNGVKRRSSNPLAAKQGRALLAGGIALVLAVFFLMPVPFRLHPESRLAPVAVRFVVGAFDSLLEEVLVEPGKRVEAGQELARLDGREIDLELRAIQADSAKALKMRDSYLVSGDVAAAQIARLEYERLQERAFLLGQRQQQLVLTSPVEGVVLSGDLKREEGGPVNRGEVLFEIAALERLRLEMAVPDDDIAHVREGQAVQVRFDAFPGRIWSGKVQRVAPMSEMLQGKNIFVASLDLENEGALLLPGMRGKASIACGRRSLAWIYLRKPWQALRRLLLSLP